MAACSGSAGAMSRASDDASHERRDKHHVDHRLLGHRSRGELVSSASRFGSTRKRFSGQLKPDRSTCSMPPQGDCSVSFPVQTTS